MDFSAALSGLTGSTGTMEASGLDALQKALTAGYGTDVANLTGGGALRIQSLDKTLQSVIQENQDFRLFNRLAKQKATANVDEWTEQNGIGGFPGSATSGEADIINESTGSYNRRVGNVKFQFTKRSVSFVSTLQNNIADIEAVEYANGALELCTTVEHLMFEGNDLVVPTEFSGIQAQLEQGIATGQIDGSHVIDARGDTLNSVVLLNRAAATIRGVGSFGKPTDLFMSLDTQADFDNRLDPAFRVALTGVANGAVMIGAPVTGIRTSHGPIATNDDIFIRDSQRRTPFEVQYAKTAATQVALKPQAVVAAVAVDAASQFAALQAGNYFYLVTGVNAQGQSQGTVSAQVAVAAGQSVTLTITGAAGGTETGYVVSRSRLNGGNVVVGGVDGVSDFREMKRISRQNGGTTLFVDQNRDIPGTTQAYVLNLTPGATAINWRQLLPMVKFPLFPTNAAVVPWAQLMAGYLRISKRAHHVVIKNVLPTQSAWRPFNV